MICNSSLLKRELKDDEFIFVEIDGEEYVIDHIARRKDYYDSISTHLCLVCRDGGSGNIKR